MIDSFYRDFEDAFRGSCSTIKARLRVYLPFILPLKNIYPDLQVVDLGCGRGEWLELMRDEGIDAYGVDLDVNMLQACQDAGLKSSKADAISFLKSLPANSKAVITAFHLVEHISFEELKELVLESYRVLMPMGLLILETPNSENLKVGTSSFYLDPTHVRPIPAALLEFLSKYYGFSHSKIVRLQESPELANKDSINLIDVLNGVSPDYSVIAQKRLTHESTYLFDAAFKDDYGLTLDKLAEKYDSYRDVEVANLRKTILEFQTISLLHLEQNKLIVKQNELTLAQNELTLKQIDGMRNSFSWKITKPLRIISTLLPNFWHTWRGRN